MIKDYLKTDFEDDRVSSDVNEPWRGENETRFRLTSSNLVKTSGNPSQFISSKFKHIIIWKKFPGVTQSWCIRKWNHVLTHLTVHLISQEDGY